MKLAFLALPVIAASICLAACDKENSTSATSRPKTCVVDLQRLMRESAPGKDGVKFIDAQQQQMQKELDEIQTRLEKNPQDTEAMQQLQQTYALSQQKIQAEGQNVVSQLFDVIQRELNLYQKENGYDYILEKDALAAYNPELDKTSEVLALLDKQKIEFRPLPKPSASEQNQEIEVKESVIIEQPAEKPNSEKTPAGADK